MENKTVSLWLVLLVVFLDWMGIGLVYPMFSSMLFHPEGPLLDPNTSAAIRSWYLGMLLASMSIAQFFSGPILGALSDQKGRRRIFLMSLLIGVGGYLLCMLGALWKSASLLIGARFIVGVASGNASVVSATVADLSSVDSKAKNFGLYSMACGVGFTVGPFLGGKFSKHGFEIPFILAALAIFINFLLIYFYFQETHEGKKNSPIRINEGLKNLTKAFRMQGLRTLFISSLIFCFGWSFFYEFIPVTWIHDYNFNAEQIGYAYAYGAAFYALSAGCLIRPFVKRFEHAALLFYSLIIMGVIILPLLARPSQNWLWLYLPLLNFFTAMIWPTSSTMVSNFAAKDAQGETLGVFQSIQAAAFALSPLAAGSLLAANPHLPLLIAGIAMLIAALVFGWVLRKKVFS